ncbi:hypothetical protein TW95_gp0099 [Pandoravirus inopinatum]|uniref:Uncharacterized protein n=1 Tax=Pandoravirus inopinatum TaxID=1605721 RepID=A0A0B5IVZ0_9VIRU|nr:hypothetical protein TW95_gp0099 [Pandoravirus inopinatum]AJF96833.1 hypothetical protein [Pandoravirus inopinatum]
MAAVMLDRLGIAGTRDPRDTHFQDTVRYVRAGGRLYASIDRAVAATLSRAHGTSLAASAKAPRTNYGTDDGLDRQERLFGDDADDPVVRSAWWLYQARVAERLCMADLDPDEFIEREDPLDLVVRPCGPIAQARRAAHLYSLAYSAEGLVCLFDRMQRAWADRAFGSDLVWIARAGGPLACVAARLALASRSTSLVSRRRYYTRQKIHHLSAKLRRNRPCVRQQSGGVDDDNHDDDDDDHNDLQHDRAPGDVTCHDSVMMVPSTPTPATTWPVAHMSLDFMDRLQAVINRRPPVAPHDAPLTPPFADQPDPWTPIDG